MTLSHMRSTSGVRAGQRLYASGLAALERQRTIASACSQVILLCSLCMSSLHIHTGRMEVD